MYTDVLSKIQPFRTLTRLRLVRDFVVLKGEYWLPCTWFVKVIKLCLAKLLYAALGHASGQHTSLGRPLGDNEMGVYQ